MTDKMVTQIVTVNTNRVVVPVAMPRSLCARNINVRGVTWLLDPVRGQAIVDAARWAGKLRVQ